MKKKTKKILLIILLVLMLIPIKLYYKDGGSVEYRAVLYSITKYHMIPDDFGDYYLEGWKISIFGITVYDDYPD